MIRLFWTTTDILIIPRKTEFDATTYVVSDETVEPAIKRLIDSLLVSFSKVIGSFSKVKRPLR